MVYKFICNIKLTTISSLFFQNKLEVLKEFDYLNTVRIHFLLRYITKAIFLTNFNCKIKQGNLTTLKMIFLVI